MGSVNKVFLVGNIARAPELKYSQSGNAVANFRLATSEKYKDQEQTEYHTIVMFGKQAESLTQYLEKGRAIAVVGKLQTRSWEKNGQKHESTEIIADDVQFCGSRNNTLIQDQPQQSQSQQPQPEDDLSF